MNVLHLNTGNETGGGMFHILSLLKQIKEEVNVTLGVFYEGEMAKRARSIGIRVQLFEQKFRFDLSILKDLISFIDENNIHILHSHGARANFVSLLIKRKITSKWFITVHSNPWDDFQGLAGKLFIHLNLFSIKKADRILAISERFQKELIEIGVKPEKINTILNGIDFNVEPKERYQRQQFGLKEQDFVIMMIARLEPVKCHEVAFFALRQLLDKSKQFKLILVGSGSRMKELKEKVGELNIDNHVLFLGQRDDIPELLTLTDITILTSKSESFPLVLLESARAKKPFVTTDVGGVENLIPDERYGRIVQVGDYNELAKQIWDLYQLKETNLLLEMGERIYLYASQHFSEQQFAQSVLNVYINHYPHNS